MAKSECSDLLKPIGHLKGAAIDAYMMHSEGLKYMIEGNKYVSINPSVVVCGVLCPRVDGAGDGGWSSELFTPHQILDGERNKCFSDLSNPVRNIINEVSKPWKGLSDLGDFEPHIDIVRDIPSRLATSSEVRNSIIIDTDDIACRVVLTNNNLNSMSGATIRTFKGDYLGRLPDLVGGVYNAAMLWGVSLGSEKAIFEGTRKEIVTVIKQAIGSFKPVVKGPVNKRRGGFSIALAADDGLTYLTGGTGLTTFGNGILNFLKNSLRAFRR